MAKIAVVYWSATGNTEAMANAVADGAKEKGAENRPCAGCADILLFPDIHAGNITYKAIDHLVPDVQIGCILTGTTAPVILTSRSDTKQVKINSIALAAVLSDHMKKVNG